MYGSTVNGGKNNTREWTIASRSAFLFTAAQRPTSTATLRANFSCSQRLRHAKRRRISALPGPVFPLIARHANTHSIHVDSSPYHSYFTRRPSSLEANDIRHPASSEGLELVSEISFQDGRKLANDSRAGGGNRDDGQDLVDFVAESDDFTAKSAFDETVLSIMSVAPLDGAGLFVNEPGTSCSPCHAKRQIYLVPGHSSDRTATCRRL